MFCAQCGSKNAENSKFCDTCGAPLENLQEDTAAEQIESQADSTQAIESQNDSTQAFSYEQPTEAMPPYNANIAEQPNSYADSYPNSYSTDQPYPNGAFYPQADFANRNANASKNKKQVIIITVTIAIVVCVLAICGGVWWYVTNGKSNKAHNQTKIEQVKNKKDKKQVKKDDGFDVDNKDDEDDKSYNSKNKKDNNNAVSENKKLNIQKIDNLIKDFSQNHVASVAIADKNKILYETSNSHTKLPAVGFYFPVILHAEEVSDYNYEQQYENVIKTMSNESANELIDAQGGLDGLNSWLSNNGYSDTSFARKFGDVNASKEGNENYTSSHDAALMLSKAMGNSFITNPTGYNVANDGVRIPSGITIMAHRGQGIQNAYNYFMIIKSGDKMLGMSVLTSSADKSEVAGLVSNLLDLLKNNL